MWSHQGATLLRRLPLAIICRAFGAEDSWNLSTLSLVLNAFRIVRYSTFGYSPAFCEICEICGCFCQIRSSTYAKYVDVLILKHSFQA
jgi:hypothetical protein